MMDVAEVEESLFAASDAKLHGGMCRILSVTVCKILEIFPVLEAARPRSRTGIQALCSLHVALEKAKNLLRHCSDCSKLYLAITGDSVLLKFEKARCALMDSLKRVEDIVTQAIGCQILEIVNVLQGTIFSLDPSEKQIGEEVIQLLQKDRKSNSNCNVNSELETFHQAASRLGITSSKAALTERRALKKLLERARIEEDKRKESIVAYLLHLMRKYSKLFRSEVSDGNDSQGSSTPCSPTVQVSGSFEECSGTGRSAQAFQSQHSKLSSLNFMLVPPEELRCPISLRLMCDPVIISSGQTYERVCIERWFNDGHTTCPKTEQQLSHLCLTPNYCVKGLISSWCEQNGVSVPDSPPDSLDLNYWSLALSECDSTNSISMASIDSYKLKGVKAVPLEDSGVIEEFEENRLRDVSCQEDCEVDMFDRYESLLDILCGEEDISRQCEVVEQIRIFLKVDEEARIFLGANGFVDPLVRFLSLAIHGGNEKAQEIGAMALFNLAVNNNRNKRMMLSAGIIPLLEEMICNSYSFESSTALYLNLSCLEEAKPIIGSSPAVPFLIRLLKVDSEAQCKLDSLHALYNLSTYSPNIPNFLSAGIIEGLQTIVKGLTNLAWVEKAIGVIINLATNESVKEEMISALGIISGVAAILDLGEPIEQEHAASCLLVLCNGNEKCSEMVLQEGVIPSLVSISVNGTNRGKDKAQKLLKLFREQRQREPLPIQIQQQQKPETSARSAPTPDMKPPCKSTSKKMSKSWSSIWKSKNYSVHQC